MVDKKRAETAVRELIAAMGEDAEREGLKETPARVARMLEELTAGYADSAKEHLSKTFEEGGSALGHRVFLHMRASSDAVLRACAHRVRALRQSGGAE